MLADDDNDDDAAAAAAQPDASTTTTTTTTVNTTSANDATTTSSVISFADEAGAVASNWRSLQAEFGLTERDLFRRSERTRLHHARRSTTTRKNRIFC
jgi:hypothetical protein